VVVVIHNGSIEVVVGEDSEGTLITADNPLDETNLEAEVTRLTGATVGDAQENRHEAYGCLGVWTGTNRAGEQAKVSVWELQP
jgi:hypothetical protein